MISNVGKIMKLSDIHRFTVVTGIFLWGFFSSSLSFSDPLRYSKEHTIGANYIQEETWVTSYKDTLLKDSIFMVGIKERTPLHYFQHITTNVCFDNECRLLTITVYWNITGRYLGFELSDGEFLSKRDHEPFSQQEYERLNDLLADPDLPLGGISFEKLIEIPESESDSIDGISGATTKHVSQMVVKGAAYTTYTLWNIVYGPTQDWVASLTEKQLSPDLIDQVLQSPDISDRVWALRRISQEMELTPGLTTTLLGLIAGEDFFLAYSAINGIKKSHLQSDDLQLNLFDLYGETDHSIQNMIVNKLMDAPHLNLELITSSRKMLPILNGKQLGDILKLYTKHGINDLETCKAVAEILKNENSFISRQAYHFLKVTNTSNKEILTILDRYKY